MAKSLSELIGEFNAISLYIHIPFCKKKCYYCDFVSFTEGSVENYIMALLNEIDLYVQEIKRGVRTLYIGGGTPSFINEYYIKKIIDKLSPYLELEEFTIEVNPDSFDAHKAEFYRNLGVNRISLGIQSFDDNVLKKAGRTHSSKQALRAYKIAEKYFDNVNVDFIIGLPGENWRSIENIVDFIRFYVPPHISVYLLEIHEGTFLEKFYKKLPDEAYERYDAILKFLKLLRYERYEISNFTLNKKYSKHNLVYWANLDYLGFGISAGGHIGNMRYNNVSTFEKYYTKLKAGKFPIEYKVFNKLERETLESIFMMLRTKWGIDRKLIAKLPKLDTFFQKLSSKYRFFDGTKLNDTGMDFSNLFFGELLKTWEEFYED
ncbi:radical SAM family heme chaperone HemW [Thermosipho atlanticus]|uniref:Heme chaperone HemW n=1 Tax=Thermosipho atlanticus DSM 15807 TaxID=1123380 RepID=A0A1M5TJ93_9BACT|nr:radical SAM family heme chaperone HemW [Thermosipho atlanticus]SHH50875.1 coproporphyrinogen III oxidase, anaerobic [Thermosipho atlanticus DSM 15807]